MDPPRSTSNGARTPAAGAPPPELSGALDVACAAAHKTSFQDGGLGRAPAVGEKYRAESKFKQPPTA